MNKLLTIVIPTYNMEAYLNRCLYSLIVSNDKLQLIEVLVINDGSKDNSSAISHEYETKFPNIFRVIDKENGNYGSCINRGLKEATGKYIKILDADDWFDTNALELFITELLNYDVDMILTPYWIVDDQGLKQKEMLYDMEYNKIFSFQSYTNSAVYFAMHSITYRTEILRTINYLQTEGISYTDTEWVFYPQHAIDTCVYLNCNLYQYVIGREGQTMDPKVLVKSAGHYEKLIRSMISYANLLTYDDKQKHSYQRLEAQIMNLSLGVYKTCLILQDSKSWDEELLTNFDAFIKEERPHIYITAGNLMVKEFPFRYVKFWRLTRYRLSLDKLRTIYRIIKYGKR